MVTKKMQLKAHDDAIGELLRRVRTLEDEIDTNTMKYVVRSEIKQCIKAYMEEEVGYKIVKIDQDQIVVKIKSNNFESLINLNIK